jgi:hypothetical protein
MMALTEEKSRLSPTMHVVNTYTLRRHCRICLAGELLIHSMFSVTDPKKISDRQTDPSNKRHS